MRRGINVPFCYTRAMTLYTVKCLTTPELPNNGGMSAPISAVAPPGCLLNAEPPSPTGARHMIGHYVAPLVFGALAEAAPDRVQADCGMMNLLTVQGRHRNGRAISTIYFAAGGFGALRGHDGAETLPGPSNMAVVPVEVWETLTGTTIEHKRLLADSGGAGAARGGLGQEVVIRNDTGHPLTVLCMANRTEFVARGLAGGSAGAPREHRINGQAVDPRVASSSRPAIESRSSRRGAADTAIPVIAIPIGCAATSRTGSYLPARRGASTGSSLDAAADSAHGALSVSAAMTRLQAAVSTPHHRFLADDVSLLDDTVVDRRQLSSPRQLTGESATRQWVAPSVGRRMGRRGTARTVPGHVATA